MKVAIVVEWVDPWRGGAETSTTQFVQHLLERDVYVDLITRSRVSPAPGMGVRTIAARGPSRGRASAAFAAAAAEATAGGYDVVHAITPCLTATVYEPRGGTVAETIERNIAIRVGRAAQALKRLTARFQYRQRVMLDLERRLLTNPHPPVVIAISDYVARQLVAHYAFPPDRIRHIFNGVDPDLSDAQQRVADRAHIRALYGLSEDDLVVLLVAHNFKLKGVGCWIAALVLLKDTARPAVRSLIVGKGNPLRYQRRAHLRGVASMIHFVGPTQRMAAFYHAADVLVHPTYYDPCSRVVLEGLASGLPVVTTRFDGAAEVVEHGVNGFVLESPTRTADMAAHVQALFEPDLRRRFSLAAAAGVPRISMERHADQVLALYRELNAPSGVPLAGSA